MADDVAARPPRLADHEHAAVGAYYVHMTDVQSGRLDLADRAVIGWSPAVASPTATRGVPWENWPRSVLFATSG